MPSHFRMELENWLKKIDVKEKLVLDVGGAQKPIKGRTKSWDVEDCKILDLENPHESKKNVDIEFDLNNDEWNGKFASLVIERHNVGFDIAFCLEVMEYLYKPFTALCNIGAVVKKGGILYISFPFVYPLHPPHKMDFLRYTKYGAIKLLEEAGFEVLEYVARNPKSKKDLMNFYRNEGYKWDKQELFEDLIEVGCLIEARKI